MWTPGIPDAQWDEALFASGGHFLQSSHNAAVQVALGKPVFYARGDGWWCLATIDTGKLGSRIYCPYGPLATDAKAFDAACAALKQLAVKQDVPFVRFEPVAPLRAKDLQKRGLFFAVREIQPQYTWVQDLTKPQDELLADMTSTNRNLYRTATNKGLSFRTSTEPKDMQIFINMIHDVAAHTGMRPLKDHHFQVMAGTLLPRCAAKLYIAEHEGKPVATAFTFDSPTTRYYAHGAAYRTERKLHPSTPMLIQMILDAKQAGQKQFDFYGVAPPDQPNHKWAGLSKFKQSFGGELKTYLGTWEMPVNPVWYRLLRAIKKIVA